MGGLTDRVQENPDLDLGDITRHEWERVLRRVDLTPHTKLVGLTLATYANRDGTNAFPSVVRLIATTGTSKRTVLRALTQLRSLGLVERVSEGSKAGRRGLADVYRLTIPGDLLSRCSMLPPTEIGDSDPGAPLAPVPAREQGVDVAPDVAGSGANGDWIRCHPGQDQVPLTTGSGATSSPPQVHDHPVTNHEDKGVDLEASTSPTEPDSFTVARTVLSGLGPEQQQQLLEEAQRQLGGAADQQQVVCRAADLHNKRVAA